MLLCCQLNLPKKQIQIPGFIKGTGSDQCMSFLFEVKFFGIFFQFLKLEWKFWKVKVHSTVYYFLIWNVYQYIFFNLSNNDSLHLNLLWMIKTIITKINIINSKQFMKQKMFKWNYYSFIWRNWKQGKRQYLSIDSSTISFIDN